MSWVPQCRWSTVTYAVVDWDATEFFGPSPNRLGAQTLSHEVGEWMDDPIGVKLPPGGDIGEIFGCDAYLEVEDPLSGKSLAPITMPNN
jgi:hypothetical protein